MTIPSAKSSGIVAFVFAALNLMTQQISATIMMSNSPIRKAATMITITVLSVCEDPEEMVAGLRVVVSGPSIVTK